MSLLTSSEEHQGSLALFALALCAAPFLATVPLCSAQTAFFQS